MYTLNDIAIIIPISPSEDQVGFLLQDLKHLPAEVEFIIVKSKMENQLEENNSFTKVNRQIKLVESKMGRAIQMNAGARATSKKVLWFLHADTRISENTIHSLKKKLEKYSPCVLYFDLTFRNDGPWLTKFNEIGVWIKSHVLKIPFGDQGFCVSQDVFKSLGGFNEKVLRGEDHFFVWKARKAKIPVVPVGETISTSARKYQHNGWIPTTYFHVRDTIVQAIPQWVRLIRGLK